MTIVSHRWKFIFLHVGKTAGSSIELWLAQHLGPRDWITAGEEYEPSILRLPYTRNATTPYPRLENLAKAAVKRLGWKPFSVGAHENLIDELAEEFSALGLPMPVELPRAKSGLRRPDDSINQFTDAQIDQIARIHSKQIAVLGYKHPRRPHARRA